MLAPLAGRIYLHAPQQNAFPLGTSASMSDQTPLHHAHVTWASDRELATGQRLIHPVWFEEDGPSGEGWSVVLTLTEPVAWGDKTSEATVRFLVAEAPHKHLRPGREFQFRAGTTPIASVKVGAPVSSSRRDA